METTNQTLAVSNPRFSRFAGPAWLVPYLILATLDLGAVSYTLYQQNRVVSQLDRRAISNEALDRQDRAIRRLAAIAVQIDTAANDIPAPGVATKSRAELHAAQSAMWAALTSLRVSTAIGPRESRPMTPRVDQITRVMRELAAASDDVLAAHERGDLAASARQNARLDAAHRAAGRILYELSISLDQRSFS